MQVITDSGQGMPTPVGRKAGVGDTFPLSHASHHRFGPGDATSVVQKAGVATTRAYCGFLHDNSACLTDNGGGQRLTRAIA